MSKRPLAPLRRVVSVVPVCIMGDGSGVVQMRESLECGHVIRIKHDFVGETNAYRRRCHDCRREMEGERQPATETDERRSS